VGAGEVGADVYGWRRLRITVAISGAIMAARNIGLDSGEVEAEIDGLGGNGGVAIAFAVDLHAFRDSGLDAGYIGAHIDGGRRYWNVGNVDFYLDIVLRGRDREGATEKNERNCYEENSRLDACEFCHTLAL